jgi:hypothetical protein
MPDRISGGVEGKDFRRDYAYRLVWFVDHPPQPFCHLGREVGLPAGVTNHRRDVLDQHNLPSKTKGLLS